jgi:hypothetical protein
MPPRKDSLPRPVDAVGLRVEVDPATRDRLRVVAAERGYSMASFLRLLVELATTDARVAGKVPKKSR